MERFNSYGDHLGTYYLSNIENRLLNLEITESTWNVGGVGFNTTQSKSYQRFYEG